MDIRSNGNLFTQSPLRASIREMPTFNLAALYTFEDADAGPSGSAWGKSTVDDLSGFGRHATFLSGSSAFDRGAYIGTSASLNNGLVMISPMPIQTFGTIVGVVRQTVGSGGGQGTPGYWQNSAALGASTTPNGVATPGGILREDLATDLSADVRRRLQLFTPAQSGGPAADQTRSEIVRLNPQSFIAFALTWQGSVDRLLFKAAGVYDTWTTAGVADCLSLGTSPKHAFGIIKQGADLVKGDMALFAIYGQYSGSEAMLDKLLDCAIGHCATKNIIAM